ncbi:hypothetical protein DRP05_03935 [Archaeoglobales archaeon]|nr:MAG: hypothetical protein DRP05_03935 [Archaeoglobales archaeon]
MEEFVARKIVDDVLELGARSCFVFDGDKLIMAGGDESVSSLVELLFGFAEDIHENFELMTVYSKDWSLAAVKVDNVAVLAFFDSKENVEIMAMNMKNIVKELEM